MTGEGFVFHRNTQTYSQVVHISNDGTSSIPEPLWLVLDNLSTNATLSDADGTTAVLAPLGSPYVSVPVGGDGILHPHEVKTVHLEFSNPSGYPITYTAGGKQYVAVTTGPSLVAATSRRMTPELAADSGGARVVVFALP